MVAKCPCLAYIIVMFVSVSYEAVEALKALHLDLVHCRKRPLAQQC